jgi:phosphoribosylglycinamide formyltransferase-1
MSAAETLRIVVLASGSGTNLQAIIDRIAAGDLPAEIAAVISDRPDAFALERASRNSIPAVEVDYAASADRDDYDARLESALARANPALVVLAGYMRILPDATVNRYLGRMLNVHPSLLPAYPGLHTYRRALAAGERYHGTTVHFVTPELDAGPAILQYRVRIRPGETEPELQARVQQGEYRIYPQAIGWYAQGRVRMRDGRVWLDDKPLEKPVVIDE